MIKSNKANKQRHLRRGQIPEGRSRGKFPDPALPPTKQPKQPKGKQPKGTKPTGK